MRKKTWWGSSSQQRRPGRVLGLLARVGEVFVANRFEEGGGVTEVLGLDVGVGGGDVNTVLLRE